MTKTINEKEEITIKFAGDSGDGMQLTGSFFTGDTALSGNDLATFPDFPAEIRAPVGTLAGVSGFQLHFGARKIFTPGDEVDVLVAMNAAALKANLSQVKSNGTLIINESGFDKKNLRLAHIETTDNPLTNGSLGEYEVHQLDLTKLTQQALADSNLSRKEKDRCKNMFVLGFLLWRYNRQLDTVADFIQQKFYKKPDILEANLNALRAGYHFGDTTETFTSRYQVAPAQLEKGTYRHITGNLALTYGLICATKKAGISLFYGSYPITPASDILHFLAAQKKHGVKTFQAEDEIAAACAAIGASYGGHLGITGTSGPGMALKGEAMGLALMLELPLVILDIQRGGPSTGLPTKTEQSDLLMALYGRNGESPMPVLAAASPTDCFDAAYEACRIAIEHMTPVLLLSDGYIANGAAPWKIKKFDDLPAIAPPFAESESSFFLPYQRDEKHVRQWAIPGMKGLTHRIGGLEKEANTGNVSYNPANHEYMVKIRAAKIAAIAPTLPPQQINLGPKNGETLILGWGSTYGVIESVVTELLEKGHTIAHVHLRYLNPLPENLEEILGNFEKIIIPELNNGQLSRLIRERFLIDVIPYHKIQGLPITHSELIDFIKQTQEIAHGK